MFWSWCWGPTWGAAHEQGAVTEWPPEFSATARLEWSSCLILTTETIPQPPHTKSICYSCSSWMVKLFDPYNWNITTTTSFQVHLLQLLFLNGQAVWSLQLKEYHNHRIQSPFVTAARLEWLSCLTPTTERIPQPPHIKSICYSCASWMVKLFDPYN